jgi:TonB family protein
MPLSRFRSATLFLSLAVVLLSPGINLAQTTSSQGGKQVTFPIRKNGTELRAQIIKQVEPVYPSPAKAAGIGGRAYVELTIDEQGDVISAKPVDGHPLFMQAAIEAAKEWKFKPFTVDDKPVKVVGMIFLPFSNSDGSIPYNPLLKDRELAKAEELEKIYPFSPEVQFWIGTILSREGQIEEAIKAYKKVLQIKPDYELAYMELGQIYNQLKQPDLEIQTYQEAVKANVRSIELLKKLARALSNKKRYEEAVVVTRKVLEIYNEEFDSLIGLGWLYLQLERYEDSIGIHWEAIKLRPDYAMAYQNLGAGYEYRGQLQDAIDAYQKAIELNPKLESVYATLGYLYGKLNRYEEVIQVSKRALEINPRLYIAWFNLATGYANIRRHKEAIDAYKKASEVNPEFAKANIGLGGSFLLLGRFEEAVSSLNQAIKLEPDNIAALHNLGAVYVKMRRFQDAIAVYKQAIQVKKPYASLYKIHFELGAVYTLSKRDAESIEAYRQALKLKPDDVTGHVYLAHALNKTGKWTEAEAEYIEALRLGPNDPLALNDYGLQLVERNERLDEAFIMVKRAADALPNNAFFLDSLGWAYFKLGKLDDAERILTQVTQLESRSAKYYDHLGDVYHQQGKGDLAEGAWQKALSITSDDELKTKIKNKLSKETIK